jgi:serine/threonine protein kinase/WD40 repeat protein
MGESVSPSDVFNDLAYEFAERLRHGERPSLQEYTDRYPELAAEIRELFPTLVIVEQLGSGHDNPSDLSAGPPPQEESVPQRLGDYRILREIGRGGMGIVYEAEHESLGRRVALKVLPHHRHRGAIELIRFQREARAVALLHHTNIVPVFRVGVDEGVHFYAMQYIDGRSLDSVLREIIKLRGMSVSEGNVSYVDPDKISASLAIGLLTNQFWVPTHAVDSDSIDSPGPALPATWSGPSQLEAESVSGLISVSSTTTISGRKERHYYRSVARLGMQAAEALSHAHAHGVIHRDIKPANLLLDLQGTIWVTDFGLAKAERAEVITTPGDVVGTLRYLAPERFKGQTGKRSDIYSLGLSLYKMLTLRPAFPASHRPQLIKSIIDSEPVRPRKLDPQIPRDLETIVLKAIAKKPSDRFSSAIEMAKELGRYVEGRPIRSRRLSVPERIWRSSRRNPAIAMLTLLAMLLTTILAITSTTAAWKFRDQRDAVQNEQENTRAELARSLLLQGRALRYSRQSGRRAEGLETVARAAIIARARMARSNLVDELRDEAIATLAEVDERRLQTWLGLDLSAQVASFSFDSDRYVVLGTAGSLHVHRLADQAEIDVIKSERPSTLSWPLLIPGGRFVIVLSGSERTEFWDLERREVPAVWPADVRGAMHRPDGRQVAALLSGGELRIYNLPAMTESTRFPLGRDIPKRIANKCMALSEDGRYLALMRADTQDAWVYEVASGRVVLEMKIPIARVHRTLALSRNGGLLAVTHDRAVSVYDVANGERLCMLQGHQSEGINAWFQPGGTALASECWDGTTRVWDPIRGDLLVAMPGNFRGWAGVGPNVVIGQEHDLVVYQIAPGKERRTIDCRMLSEQAGAALYGPARLTFSPDGQMIAMALRPEGVRIVRTSDGVGLAHVPIGNCDEVLYLPDGSLLTCNDRGLCRWPVRPSETGALQMGPPEPLAPITRRSGFVHVGLAASASGRLIGIASQIRQGSMLLDPESPWRKTWLVPHRRVFDLAISPDGRWAATSGLEPSADRALVKVWDAATGRLDVDLPVGSSYLAFSPDGQWLGVNGTSHYRFFRTGSWTRGPEIDYGAHEGAMRMAFHPGSRLAALLDASQSVARLVEVETGREIAAFESPDKARLH